MNMNQKKLSKLIFGLFIMFSCCLSISVFADELSDLNRRIELLGPGDDVEQLLLQRGLLYESLRLHKQARRDYRRIIREKKDSPVAAYSLGMSLLKSGKTTNVAFAYFADIIRNAADVAWLGENLGIYLQALCCRAKLNAAVGNAGAVLTDLDTILNLEEHVDWLKENDLETYVDALVGRININFAAGSDEAALNDLEVLLNPLDGVMVGYLTGHSDRARAIINIRAKFLRAIISDKRGNYADFIEHANRLVPVFTYITASRGWVARNVNGYLDFLLKTLQAYIRLRYESDPGRRDDVMSVYKLFIAAIEANPDWLLAHREMCEEVRRAIEIEFAPAAAEAVPRVMGGEPESVPPPTTMDGDPMVRDGDKRPRSLEPQVGRSPKRLRLESR
jgi:hypothetical protein